MVFSILISRLLEFSTIQFFPFFFKFISFLVFKPQQPRNLLEGLIIDYCKVAKDIGMVFNASILQIFVIFAIKI